MDLSYNSARAIVSEQVNSTGKNIDSAGSNGGYNRSGGISAEKHLQFDYLNQSSSESEMSDKRSNQQKLQQNPYQAKPMNQPTTPIQPYRYNDDIIQGFSGQTQASLYPVYDFRYNKDAGSEQIEHQKKSPMPIRNQR